MKLFYYKDATGNFGDDLNPWLWYSLLPELFLKDSGTNFLGIGTLINDRAPRDGKKYVFGAGVGYHKFPVINGDWFFDFVRGPLSAKALGLNSSKYITDPAILVAKLVQKRIDKISSKVCYMPHQASAGMADWNSLCREAGVFYLNPASDIHEIIFHIQSSELVLAEAMHAAIVADALRVPWIAVKAYPHILDFKWQDWCGAMCIEYNPISITSVYDYSGKYSKLEVAKFSLKRFLKNNEVWSEKWWEPPLATNIDRVGRQVVDELCNLARYGVGAMSSDVVFSERLARVDCHLLNIKDF